MSGAWLLGRIGPTRRIPAEEVNAIAFWSLIGAIIGSRFFYVLAHLSEFHNLGQMLAVWRGGISLLGGIAGATLINVPRVRRTRLPLLPGGRRRRAGPRVRDRDRSYRRSHHRGSPGRAHLVGAGVAVRGRHGRAPVRVCGRPVPGGTAGGAPRDDPAHRGAAPGRSGQADRGGSGRPSDGPVRHDHRVGALRAPLVLHAAPPATRGRHHPHVRARVRLRADPGGLAPDRQALRPVHRIAVDGARRGAALGGDLDLVGAAPVVGARRARRGSPRTDPRMARRRPPTTASAGARARRPVRSSA